MNGYLVAFLGGVAFAILVMLGCVFLWGVWASRGELGELPQNEATRRSGYMRGRDGFAHKIR